MSKNRYLSRVVRILLLAVLSLLGLFFLLVMAISSSLYLVIPHLFGGFFFFLNRNIPAISSNPATWIPGVIAFVLALVVAHRFLRSWATTRNRLWDFRTTLCIGLFLPVLFIIAFIVPGVLLQAESLRECPWFEKDRTTFETTIRSDFNMLYLSAYDMTESDPEERLPHSLDDLIEHSGIRRSRITAHDNLPPEPMIYLGAGQTLSSGDSLPLLISPPYKIRGVLVRLVITLGYETIQIRDEDVDEWIDRVFPRAE